MYSFLNYLAATDSSNVTDPLPRASFGTSSPISTILYLVFGILGAVSLIVIILAGVRLIMSTGDPQKVAQARETIIYAAVGMATAISAATILSFVLGKV